MENLNESAENVLKDLAHDVKTPLTSILGFTQLLLEDETISGSTREYLELIETDAKRLNEIVLNAVLHFESESTTPISD